MYQVSILVPVYKVEKYIERCARSLLEQTYKNLEYIFVDDCSPDKSVEILKDVMKEYPDRKEHVHIVSHKKNRGLAASRNTALDAAIGTFICNVDSDDYLDLDAVRLLVEKQMETGADIVSGNSYIILPSGIKKAYDAPYNNQHEMLLKALASRGGTHSVCRRLIKLSLYKDNNIRPKEGVNNLEDWQQTAPLVYCAKSIARIDDHIYYYNCVNENSYMYTTSNQASIRLWDQSIESVKIMEDFFSDKEQEYRDLARRAVLYMKKSRMCLAARHRNREYFEKMKNEIATGYTDCYDEIGWDKPLVRAFICNYTLNGFCRRAYALCRRIFFPNNR